MPSRLVAVKRSTDKDTKLDHVSALPEVGCFFVSPALTDAAAELAAAGP